MYLKSLNRVFFGGGVRQSFSVYSWLSHNPLCRSGSLRDLSVSVSCVLELRMYIPTQLHHLFLVFHEIL